MNNEMVSSQKEENQKNTYSNNINLENNNLNYNEEIEKFKKEIEEKNKLYYQIVDEIGKLEEINFSNKDDLIKIKNGFEMLKLQLEEKINDLIFKNQDLKRDIDFLVNSFLEIEYYEKLNSFSEKEEIEAFEKEILKLKEDFKKIFNVKEKE